MKLTIIYAFWQDGRICLSWLMIPFLCLSVSIASGQDISGDAQADDFLESIISFDADSETIADYYRDLLSIPAGSRTNRAKQNFGSDNLSVFLVTQNTEKMEALSIEFTRLTYHHLLSERLLAGKSLVTTADIKSHYYVDSGGFRYGTVHIQVREILSVVFMYTGVIDRDKVTVKHAYIPSKADATVTTFYGSIAEP